MSVTLAIPNYNGSENLNEILTQAINEKFDNIYVLDDGSTDNSKEIVAEFPEVSFIKGKENRGPAGNRNRVLDQECSDIIFFVDADMKMLTSDIKRKIEENFSDDGVALVGGLILTKNGEPMWWNYGFEMHPDRDAKAGIVHAWALDNWENPEKIIELREKYRDVTANLEISFGDPCVKKVDWVSEANFCVRTDVFKEVNGFDGRMRYHADQDLCKRIREKGYEVVHSPTIKAMHLEIDTFGEDRDEIRRKNAFYFYNKHWGMTEHVFDLLFPTEQH